MLWEINDSSHEKNKKRWKMEWNKMEKNGKKKVCYVQHPLVLNWTIIQFKVRKLEQTR